MKKLFVLLAVVVGLSGCAETKRYWDHLEPAEKVVVGVVGGVALGALIIRNGQGDMIQVGGNGCHPHGSPPNRWDCPEL